LTPTGLYSFSLKPTLPDGLDHLYLTNIKAYGGVFDVLLDKNGFRVVRSDGKELVSGSYGDTVVVALR
jgi:hypothetical protein